MNAEQKQLALRRKLLVMLPRRVLEDVSGHEKPFLASREYLLERALSNFNESTIAEIEKYIRRAL